MPKYIQVKHLPALLQLVALQEAVTVSLIWNLVRCVTFILDILDNLHKYLEFVKAKHTWLILQVNSYIGYDRNSRAWWYHYSIQAL